MSPSDPNDNDKYVFFYEWEVTSSYPESLACFSQWFDAPFVDPSFPNVVFKTCEHYMMYRKALLFDPEAADAIVQAPTPEEAKQRGREVKHFDRELWNRHADEIVESANYHKFSRSVRLWSHLSATGEKTLVEASPTDRIWGIGFDAEHAMGNIKDWGTNRMGQALTRAKERVRKSQGDNKS